MTLYGIFLVSGLAVGSIYALSGIGLVLLYRATGVLNFAYGAIGAVGALVAWQVGQWGYPDGLGWIAALLLGMLLSVGYGRFVAPHMSYRDPVVKAVATLGFAIIILGLLNWLWYETPRRLALPTDTLGMRILGVRVTATRALVFIVSVLATVGIVVFLKRTRMGLFMRSLANNRSLSSIIGIPVLRVETAAWLLSGLLAGFSGLMLGDLVRLDAGVLTFLVIPAIAAAIVGRLQSLWWTLVGGMSIGVIEAMLTLVTPVAKFRAAAPFVVAALVILWLQRKRRLTFAEDH